jgi:hypothetical protein
MNETMSLLLVAAVLAIGGAGLYRYKFEDDLVQDGGNDSSDSYNEDELDEEIIKSKPRAKGSKTKRNRTNSGSKRRY